MKRRGAIHQHGKPQRTMRGQRLWWVLAGIAVGVGGTAAALWRNADDEPRRQIGLRVPGYLGKLVAGKPASSPASAAGLLRSD